jgi:glycerol-3-phosphate acyltransferase PlsY
MRLLITFIISYIIGAIPFAFIFTRLLTGKDVRKIGSGNVGATNASRVMGIKFGLLVGVLDVLKGFFGVWVAQLLLPPDLPVYYLLMASFLTVLGHNWSIFLKFSGGKGVATTFGILLKLMPAAFLAFIIIWLSVVILTRYVSLASIISSLSIPVVALLYYKNLYITLFSLLLTALIVIRHHGNINRLIKGTERKMSWPPNIDREG